MRRSNFCFIREISCSDKEPIYEVHFGRAGMFGISHEYKYLLKKPSHDTIKLIANEPKNVITTLGVDVSENQYEHYRKSSSK